MGCIRPDQLPRDPAATERRRDARLLVGVARARLRDPATRSRIDIAALTRRAQDHSVPERTRQGAAATLARMGGLPVRLRARREVSRRSDRRALGPSGGPAAPLPQNGRS